MRETYELFSRESMQTGRNDPQEIRNDKSATFQKIRFQRFHYRSRTGSNYGRSFFIQCCVTRKTRRHLVAFHDERNWGRFIPGRNDKWKRKFPEFPNFQKKGQPRKVNRDFRNKFRKVSVPFDFEPEFSEILVEWNAPFESATFSFQTQKF